MAEWGKPQAQAGEERPKYRWEKILELPAYTGMYDLSTGEKYTVGQFSPLHKDGFENVVDYFQIIGTQEIVYIPFLRRIEDRSTCSIWGRTR